MTYSEKLKDPRWQKKRLEILNRDNFTCKLCGDSETELHVHHVEYKGEPWEQDIDKLDTLCKHCHYSLKECLIPYELIDSVMKKKAADGDGWISCTFKSTALSSVDNVLINPKYDTFFASSMSFEYVSMLNKFING